VLSLSDKLHVAQFPASIESFSEKTRAMFDAYKTLGIVQPRIGESSCCVCWEKEKGLEPCLLPYSQRLITLMPCLIQVSGEDADSLCEVVRAKY